MYFLNEADSWCLPADNTDMDMADVEIGAGCSQEAEKGGACREDIDTVCYFVIHQLMKIFLKVAECFFLNGFVEII